MPGELHACDSATTAIGDRLPPSTLDLLPLRVAARLHACARRCECPAGSTLAEAGAECTALWVVEEGTLCFTDVECSPAGDEEVVVVSHLGVGEVYGTHSHSDDATHRFGAVAATDLAYWAIDGTALAAALASSDASLIGAWTEAAQRRFASELSLHGASREALAALASTYSVLELEAGQELFPAAQEIPGVFIVADGEVQYGHLIAELGDALGLEEVALGVVAQAAATASCASRVLTVSRQELALLLADYPDLDRALKNQVSWRRVYRVAKPHVRRLDRNYVGRESTDAEPMEVSISPDAVPRVRRRPLFRQREAADCGAACLRMVAQARGHKLNYDAIRRMSRVSRYGTSMYDLLEAAETLGFRATPVEASWSDLQHAVLPAIAHLPDAGHFVVVWSASRRSVEVGDPALGNTRIKRDEFLPMWKGALLLLEPTPRLAELASSEELRPDDSSSIRKLGHFAAPYKALFGYIVAASLLLHVLGLAVPLGIQIVLDRVLARQDWPLLALVTLGLGAVALATAVVFAARYYLIFHVATRIERNVLETLYSRILDGVAGLFSRVSSMDVLNRFREVSELRDYVVDNLVTSLVDLLMIVVYGAALAYFAPDIAIAVGLFVPVIALLTLILGRRVLNHVFAYWRNYDRYYDHVKGTFDSFESVKACDLRTPVMGWMRSWLYPTLTHNFKAMVISIIGAAIVRALEIAAAAVVLLMGARAVQQDQMTIGELAAVMMLATQILSPLRRLAEEWHNFQHVYASAVRIGGLFEHPLEDEGSPAPLLTLPAVRGRISFQGVRFRYETDAKDRQRWTLDNIDFEIKPREVIGVVGRSGSGKSTLVNLLLRLYDPQRGSICIDGHNLRDVTRKSLRAQVGLVTQDVGIFSASIYDNIACGRNVDGDAVARASNLAGAYDFIQDLPYGFDTRVGERGLQLSGGQKQRIVIARALVTDPRILIFDEATAALDPVSEQLIHERLNNVVHERTTLILSHRLSTLEHADRILVFDEGRVVESGTHDELTRRRGLYYRLATASPGWRRQKPERLPCLEANTNRG